MSKFFDLKDRIYEDTALSSHITIGEVLIWLDEHPDQAPGRTITRTEYRDTLDHAVKISGYGDDWERGFYTGLTVGGTKVVPDPEPTNAEKLAASIDMSSRGLVYLTEYQIAQLVKGLEEDGVKASTDD